MEKILLLFSVISIASACSNTTPISLEEKANELCKDRKGVIAINELEKKAVCSDATTVNL